MSRDKKENNAITDTLNENTARETARYLPLREIAKLARASRSNKGLFQPILDEAKAAHSLLTCVVHGCPKSLATLVKDNPMLLFKKGQVSLKKEYGLALMSQDTRIKPNRLYIKTLHDGSLQYSVLLTPQEAPITARIKPEDLAKMGIGELLNPLTEQDIESCIKPKLGRILEITSDRGHTPAELTYYDISPYQLITFLCDEDMKESIMQLVTPMTQEMQRIRQAQYAEIDSGGADLIKMDRNPALLAFEDVTSFTKNYTIGNQATPITFPLLENPDGIIFYKNATTGFEYLYYANQRTQTVELIESKAHSQHEQTDLDDLKISLRDMENNSSRRSNNAEHALIAATMQHRLQRKGMLYEQDGKRYCDNRADFNVHFNARRKCIRLYQESKFDEGDKAWCELVGQAERKVMWLLQRIREQNRPFFQLPANFKALPFKRGFIILDYGRSNSRSVFSAGRLVSDFGSNFAIYKGRDFPWILNEWVGIGRGRGDSNSGERGDGWFVAIDLAALARFIESAKANVVEIMPLTGSQREYTAASYHRGPG